MRRDFPDDGVELLVEVCRRHTAEQFPDVVVAGDPGLVEQGVRWSACAVRPARAGAPGTTGMLAAA